MNAFVRRIFAHSRHAVIPRTRGRAQQAKQTPDADGAQRGSFLRCLQCGRRERAWGRARPVQVWAKATRQKNYILWTPLQFISTGLKATLLTFFWLLSITRRRLPSRTRSRRNVHVVFTGPNRASSGSVRLTFNFTQVRAHEESSL